MLGDLHFHTRYSDNRDRASVEEMVAAGAKRGIAIFGTGDHNHNLDREKWRRQREETGAARARFPALLILNNCEVTFRMGHFLVVDPGTIEGTIAEGYGFLYRGGGKARIIFND